MTDATSGSITYKDELDVLNEMDEFRRNLGLCPQENRLLSYLSVIDHLVFFGRVRNMFQFLVVLVHYENYLYINRFS